MGAKSEEGSAPPPALETPLVAGPAPPPTRRGYRAPARPVIWRRPGAAIPRGATPPRWAPKSLALPPGAPPYPASVPSPVSSAEGASSPTASCDAGPVSLHARHGRGGAGLALELTAQGPACHVTPAELVLLALAAAARAPALALGLPGAALSLGLAPARWLLRRGRGVSGGGGGGGKGGPSGGGAEGDGGPGKGARVVFDAEAVEAWPDRPLMLRVGGALPPAPEPDGAAAACSVDYEASRGVLSGREISLSAGVWGKEDRASSRENSSGGRDESPAAAAGPGGRGPCRECPPGACRAPEPGLCGLRHAPPRINGAPSEFETSLFRGRAQVWITTRAAAHPALYAATGKRFQSLFAVQGRFKRAVPYEDVFAGNEFAYVRNVPPQWLVKVLTVLAAKLSPSTRFGDVRDPYMLGSLPAAANVITVSAPGSEPALGPSDAVAEDMRLDGVSDGAGGALPPEARKRLFLGRDARARFSFSEDHVYTFYFWQAQIDMVAHTLPNPVPFQSRPIDLSRHLGAQPLRYAAKVPGSGEYLWCLDLWHEKSARLAPGAEARGGRGGEAAGEAAGEGGEASGRGTPDLAAGLAPAGAGGAPESSARSLTSLLSGTFAGLSPLRLGGLGGLGGGGAQRSWASAVESSAATPQFHTPLGSPLHSPHNRSFSLRHGEYPSRASLSLSEMWAAGDDGRAA